MTTAITQTITSLPNSPDPAADSPALFSSKAAASVLAQKAMVTELQTWTTQVNAVGAEIEAVADTAAASSGAAVSAAATATAQASAATTQAGAATTSADTATQALLDVQALYDQFDDRYLGAKTADPTLDNDGNPLVDGAFYINVTPVPAVVRFYSVAGGWVQGIAGVAGVSSINALTGDIVLKTVGGVAMTGAGDIAIGLTKFEIVGTTQAAVSGKDYWAINAAATVLTVPAAVDGAEFAFTPANGKFTNAADFGAATVRGPAGTAAGIVTLTLGLRMHCKYSSTLGQWAML